MPYTYSVTKACEFTSRDTSASISAVLPKTGAHELSYDWCNGSWTSLPASSFMFLSAPQRQPYFFPPANLTKSFPWSKSTTRHTDLAIIPSQWPFKILICFQLQIWPTIAITHPPKKRIIPQPGISNPHDPICPFSWPDLLQPGPYSPQILHLPPPTWPHLLSWIVLSCCSFFWKFLLCHPCEVLLVPPGRFGRSVHYPTFPNTIVSLRARNLFITFA